MMMKEYPPLLRGSAEEQAAQLRAYLVRLVQYLDESFAEIAKTPDAGADDAWKTKTENAIGALRMSVWGLPLVQYGSVSETADVVFPTSYPTAPAVFATAGTVSDVSAVGFTLSTTADAQWIAVGDPGRR